MNFLLLLYYYVFKQIVFMHKIINLFNPIWWFNKIPSVKGFYRKHGINDMNKFLETNVMNDPDNGLIHHSAFFIMCNLLISLPFGIMILFQKHTSSGRLFGLPSSIASEIYMFVFFALLPFIVLYVFVFKDRKGFLITLKLKVEGLNLRKKEK